MQGLYFLAMLIGVGWLAVWSILPKPYTDTRWWPLAWSPFDMRQDVEPAVAARAEAAPVRSRRGGDAGMVPRETQPGMQAGAQLGRRRALSGQSGAPGRAAANAPAGGRAGPGIAEPPRGEPRDEPDEAAIGAVPAWRLRAQRRPAREPPRNGR